MQLVSPEIALCSGICELEEEEIQFVGGAEVPAVLAGAAALFAVLDSAESFGRKIGKALYHATH